MTEHLFGIVPRGTIPPTKITGILERFRPIAVGTFDEKHGYYEIAAGQGYSTPPAWVCGLRSIDARNLPTVTAYHQPSRSMPTNMRLRRSCHFRPMPRRRAGFTLLELLLVLAILVVIGGIALPNFLGAGQEAKANATKVQLNSLKQSIDLFQVRMNKLPETLEELRDGPSDAAGKAKWVAPIISEIPTDAWENALTYTKNGNTYELRSAGIDGQVNTDDDVILEGA